MIRGILAATATVALAVGLTGAPAIIPQLEVGPASAAETADCSMLAHGQPCSFSYADHAGEVAVTIPPGIDEVTVVLNGAAGGGGDSHTGAAGLGGSVIAVLDTTAPESRELLVWLGQHGDGNPDGTDGWAAGGRGGAMWDGTHDGGAGGGASGLATAQDGHDHPLLVAGGGGGGGGASIQNAGDGGRGGSAGNPAGQDGTDGLSPPAKEISGDGGKGGSAANGTQHHGTHGGSEAPWLGASGGGGGGGWYGGHGGTSSYFFNYKHTAGAGGAGGGGSSYISNAVEAQYGYGLAPFGHGSISIYPNAPLPPFECAAGTAPRTLHIPDGIGAYAFVAMGGAGEHGHNPAPEGTGGFVTGVLNVAGLTDLDYWVGCSGYHDEGAGYGTPGKGGTIGGTPNDGGRGGGATAIATTDGHVLVAAGGGGGTGGDDGDCEFPPGANCGGQGGSSGGSSHSRFAAHGYPGGDDYFASGGAGGCANCHHHDGKLSRDGGDGVSPPSGEVAGAGGGGGAGYPAGGAGGHHNDSAAAGGGGAGGSYVSPSRVTAGTITASGHYGSGFLLLIPIEEPVTSLEVSAAAVGDAAAYAVAPFTFDVDCTVSGFSILDATIHLRAGQSHTFDRLEQSATCEVVQTGSGGATVPAPPEGMILGADPVQVTMESEFFAVDLALIVSSELVDAQGDPVTDVEVTLGDLRLGVECTLDGHPLVLPSPVVTGSIVVPGQDTWGEWQVVLEDLPQNAECRVEETGTGGATSVGYVVNGTGEPQPGPAVVTLEPELVAVQAMNTFRTGMLSLAKAAVGPAPAGTTYPVSVACTFEGAPVVFDTEPGTDLAVGGTADVSGIPLGSDCTITETDQGLATTVSYSPSRTVRVDTDADTDLTITNSFEAGSFHVQVGRTGDGSHWSTGGFTVQVSCTDGTADEFSTGPEGGTRSYTPDVGAECTATQTDAAGATETAYTTSADPTPVVTAPTLVVPDSGAASVAILNTYLAAPLHLVVENTGPGTRFSDGAVISVEVCEFDGVSFDAGGVEGAFTFAPGRPGGATTTPRLPVGATCHVRVADDAGGVPTLTATGADPVSEVNEVTLQVTIGDPIEGPSTVVIALDFQVAALSVTVDNEGEAASFANSPFTVQVDCRLDTDPVWGWGVDGRVMLQFAPDGTLIPDTQSALLAELPVGAGCSAVETVTGGATEWGTNPPATTVLADGAAMVVTNVFLPSTLTVTALVDGNDQAAHANQAFVFDASCWFNGLLLPVTATTPATFELAAGESRDLVVPTGADCTVTETHTWHATAVDPGLTQTASPAGDEATLTFTNVFDVDEITVRQAVSGAGADTYAADTYQAFVYCTYDDDGQFVALPDEGVLELASSGDFAAPLTVPVGATCGAREDWGLASDLVLPEPIVVALGGELELGIEAVYSLGELSVEKDARGQVAATSQYGFETFCTYNTGWDVVDIPLNDFADETYSLADGEAIMLEVLHGAECATHETQAHDPLRVAVEATGFDASTGDRTATNFVVDDIPSTVLFTNLFVGSLPLTGSELSMVTLWLGVVVLAAGLVLVLIVTVRRRAAHR